MAKDISLMGATYRSVPSVTLPTTGGGTASFVDITGTTATASDVVTGKKIFNASGNEVTGTADLSSLQLSSITESTASYPSPEAGDTGATAFGKIVKFFSDIRTALSSKVDTSKVANNITTSDEGYVLDARQGKNLNSLILRWEIFTVDVGTSSYYTINTGHAYIRCCQFQYNTAYNYAVTQDKRGLNISFAGQTVYIFQTGTIPSSGSRSLEVMVGYLNI